MYDLNKNQIESFIESRDFEIEKQTNQQIDSRYVDTYIQNVRSEHHRILQSYFKQTSIQRATFFS